MTKIEYKGVSIDPVKVLQLMEKQRDAMKVFYEYLSGGRTGPDEEFNEYDMEEIHIMALNALIDSKFKDRLMKYGTCRSDEWIHAMDMLETKDIEEHYEKMYGKS